MDPVVIGRMRVDNYLLGLPHQYNATGAPVGMLLDSSYYGG